MLSSPFLNQKCVNAFVLCFFTVFVYLPKTSTAYPSKLDNKIYDTDSFQIEPPLRRFDDYPGTLTQYPEPKRRPLENIEQERNRIYRHEDQTDDSEPGQMVNVMSAIEGDNEIDTEGLEPSGNPNDHISTIDLPLGVPDEEQNVPGEPLTPEDFENAEHLELLVPPQDEDSTDPLELAGLFEGDIAGVNFSQIEFQEKNAVNNLFLRWSRGVVPYVISASFSSLERSVIAAAVLDYQRNTCLRFVPRTIQKDYIYLQKGAGCSSYVGRSGGGQPVTLGAGCLYKGVVVHELMHAVGFWHEQSRPDRETHISIIWDNIRQGLEFNFQKINWGVMQSLGTQYDTGSVMHYGMYAFSRDRRSPTIVPKRPGVTSLGQRRGFSQIDVLKVNRLYECHVSPPTPAPVAPGGTCSDRHRMCEYWSAARECSKNPAWMLVNCRKSCRQCGVTCGNYNKHCDKWAELSECQKNPDYMEIYCPKACNACVTGTTSDCTDRNKYCAAWAKSGQCRANPSYMLRFCKQSCGQC